MSNTALIIGVTGQDGSLLAKLLLEKGYSVFGTSRCTETNDFINLKRLGIIEEVQLMTVQPEDFRSISVALEYSNAEEVYLLSGQSSVGLSFRQPSQTIKSFVSASLNLLEASRISGRAIRQYHAGSGEVFGNTQYNGANEATPFKPISPYAVGKASTYWLVDSYRNAYGLYACTGLLFNHESPLRTDNFVTQKVIKAALRICNGSSELLSLGRLDISRDWGWAPDYVVAMWMMLQINNPTDYVIGTGVSHTLQDFVKEVFSQLNMDWRRHVISSEIEYRPSDITYSNADPSCARTSLGWSPKCTTLSDLVHRLLHTRF